MAQHKQGTPNQSAKRRPWIAPRTRRLSTSAAEAGSTVSFDSVELPS
jgi:hypothetical protein